METIGQVVLAPERHTNDSHAILLAEIADLRKELAAAQKEIARLEQLLSGKQEDSQ